MAGGMQRHTDRRATRSGRRRNRYVPCLESSLESRELLSTIPAGTVVNEPIRATAYSQIQHLTRSGIINVRVHNFKRVAAKGGGLAHPDRGDFPKLVAAEDSSPTFITQIRQNLKIIERNATASKDQSIKQLLQAIKKVPITITETDAVKGDSTAATPPGQPVMIHWNPTDTSPYLDGASNIPAAALLHELTHGVRLYRGFEPQQGVYETVPVWAENWLIWRLKGQQRQVYDYAGTPLSLPADQVQWPQADKLKWNRITPALSPPGTSQTPSSGDSYYITWILGPLLSDYSDVYAGVAFRPSNIAEFSASDKNGLVSNPGDFTAIVLWGDGTRSQGQVVNYEEGGYVYPTEFVVLGSHAYAKAGDYDIQVQIVQASGYSENNAIVNSAIVDDWASINWLKAPAIPNSRIGVGFIDAVIGVFLGSWDDQPDFNPDDFQAQVAWGDGTFSNAEIEPADGVGDPPSEFMILASHTYQQAGDWQIQTQISDAASFTEGDTTTTSAYVLS